MLHSNFDESTFLLSSSTLLLLSNEPPRLLIFLFFFIPYYLHLISLFIVIVDLHYATSDRNVFLFVIIDSS